MFNNNQIFNIDMQTMIVESLFCKDIISRCDKILLPEYFNKDLQAYIKLIKEFYRTHHDALPEPIIKSYINSNYSKTNLTETQKKGLLDIIEKFCKHSAIRKTINETTDMLEIGDYGEIERRMREAVAVSLQTDAGISYYDPEQTGIRLSYMDSVKPEQTGYKDLDEVFDGGIGRKEMLLVLAKSGGGKSLFMLNISHNFVMRGYNVLYITLELAEYIVMQRYDSIITGLHKTELSENKNTIISKVTENISKGYGKFYVKRLPQSVTSANDIRNCIRNYEIETKFTPDVIVVDYLDIMASNSGTNNDNLFIKEKYIAEELREVFHDFNAIGITASQYNRSAHTTNSEELSHANIAGGISKINTSDNCIALWQTAEEKTRCEYIVKVLKARNSGGVDKTLRLSVNPKSLRISDHGFNNISAKSSLNVLHN